MASFFPISIRTFAFKSFQLLVFSNYPFQLHVSLYRLTTANSQTQTDNFIDDLVSKYVRNHNCFLVIDDNFLGKWIEKYKIRIAICQKVISRTRWSLIQFKSNPLSSPKGKNCRIPSKKFYKNNATIGTNEHIGIVSTCDIKYTRPSYFRLSENNPSGLHNAFIHN